MGPFISRGGFATSRLIKIIGRNIASLGATSQHLVTQPGRLVFLASPTEGLALRVCGYIYIDIYTHTSRSYQPTTYVGRRQVPRPPAPSGLCRARPRGQQQDEGGPGACGMLDPSRPPLARNGGPPGPGRAPQAGPAEVPLRGEGRKAPGAGAPRAGLEVQSSFAERCRSRLKRGGARAFSPAFLPDLFHIQVNSEHTMQLLNKIMLFLVPVCMSFLRLCLETNLAARSREIGGKSQANPRPHTGFGGLRDAWIQVQLHQQEQLAGGTSIPHG